jgi:hypothetical protein
MVENPDFSVTDRFAFIMGTGGAGVFINKSVLVVEVANVTL